MNGKSHEQFRVWLESEDALSPEAETALQNHLQTCTDCRSFAEMLGQLETGSWNPFRQETLTQTNAQKIVQQLRPQLRRKKMTQKTGIFNLNSAFGLAGLAALVVLFALMISQLNQTAVSPAAFQEEPTALPVSHIWYDGWETGVAFQFPATWTIANFDKEDGTIIMFATPLNETAVPCQTFMTSDANAGVWILPLDQTMPLTPVELLDRQIEFEDEQVQELVQAVTVNGRAAAYTRSEIPCEEPFNQITIMTAAMDTHYAWLSVRHNASGAEAARADLEAIIASLTPVDYTGWQPWSPAEFTFTVMTPAEWNVFDVLKALELTTSSQPMWSSFAVPDEPANPLRMMIYHNLNSQFGSTLQEVVQQHITQMEAELTMHQVEPPTGHPLIPDLVTAVYTTEDTAVFFGAIAYPHQNSSLDPIGATATVPLDQLDSFGETFERVLRSLNGYYGGIEGLSIRSTITGSDFAPTATPVPVTPPPSENNGPGTPTPTPHDIPTADPNWNPLSILATPTPIPTPN